MSINTVWGNPEGEHILLESKSDLITLLNKIGVSELEETEWLGIKILARQMAEEELKNDGVEFDPDCPEDTELFLVDGLERPIYVAPIFQVNRFMDKDSESLHIASEYQHFFQLSEENVEIDLDMYQFPCVVYANLQSDSDRIGKFELKLWHVSPLHNIKKVSDLLKHEDNNIAEWKSRLDEKERFLKEKAAYFESKSK